MDLAEQAAGIGALAEETRRALYEYVVAQPHPVGREQAAEALGLAQHNVNFHLDRLVEQGLLQTEYRRLTGRSGPGAGRPSKLYRRSSRQFDVSLPPRRYDLVGEILAAAASRTLAGADPQESIEEAAHSEGRSLGAAAAGLSADSPLRALAEVLDAQGYEPAVEGDAVILSNCPFHGLAQRHTALVCGINRDFVQGIADGLGASEVVACLEPRPGQCCVTARTSGATDAAGA